MLNIHKFSRIPLQAAYIVDDSPEYLILLKQILSRYLPGYPLEFFTGAGPLLERLSISIERNDKIPVPSVIVIDLQMPEINGLQALRRIKNPDNFDYQWWRNIPVVLNSSSQDKEIVQECLAAGAHAFLNKSVELNGLQTLIDCLLQYVDSFEYQSG